jgi:hypothetical protein
VARLALEVVPRPVVTSATPLEAPSFGEVDVTFTGTGFRPHIGLVIGGVLTAVQPAEVTPTSVRFPMPPHAVGLFSIGVRDLDTGVEALLGSAQFEYLVAPLITAVQPAAVPLLSEETITLEGGVYAADDKVWLELADGSFEEITATQTTYVDDRHHRFAAPLRSKGAYRVYVQSSDGNPNPPRTKLLTYFTFVDATAASGLEAGDDNWDAASSALADLDGDDRPELILSRRGGATATTSSQTRVLANDGSGELTDATAAVMPAVTDDDWRADRVVAADIDGDGRADLVLTTNSLTVPPAGRSHTRILMNEAKGGAGADAADRVLRDRTLDLMPAVRTMKKFGAWGGSNETYVSDDWRGLDLWVGDLDASGGRPSIVLTHDEVKNDDNPGSGGFTGGVYCGTYCATPYSSSYPYTFYWGGSRAFVWDKFARGGLGRFRFDANFFPRKSAITIPVGSGPGGIDYPLCSASYAAACKLLFTPFAGQRVAVRDLDADGRPDVAVASNQAVQRRFTRNGPMSTISSLQVGLRGFNAADGALITDVTSKLTALGLDLTGDALAIGRTGYPDGNAFGTIALTKTQALSGSALRMLRFSSPGGVLTVSDETTAERPAPGVDDAFQASALRFTDFDSDGDEDLVLLASSAPGGTQSAFRILRNEADGATKGVYRRACDDLLASLAGPADRLDGAALAIGDLSGDGLPDFLISRPAPSNATTDTRTLRMDK